MSCFSGPGWCSCPGFHLRPGASDCSPGLAFRFMGPWAFAWICCSQLPYHPCKNGTHSTSLYSTGGAHAKKHRLHSTGHEYSARSFSDRSFFWTPLGSWTSAPSGHGHPHRNACFSRPKKAWQWQCSSKRSREQFRTFWGCTAHENVGFRGKKGQKVHPNFAPNITMEFSLPCFLRPRCFPRIHDLGTPLPATGFIWATLWAAFSFLILPACSTAKEKEATWDLSLRTCPPGRKSVWASGPKIGKESPRNGFWPRHENRENGPEIGKTTEIRGPFFSRFPYFWAIFPHFRGEAKIHFSAILSYFGPEAQTDFLPGGHVRKDWSLFSCLVTKIRRWSRVLWIAVFWEKDDWDFQAKSGRLGVQVLAVFSFISKGKSQF